MRQVVPDLTTFCPMAQLFSQQQIVQTRGRNKVIDLSEDIGYGNAVHIVESEYLEKYNKSSFH